VLGCFSAAEPVLGNKDFADRLRLSKPTISRLTFTLVALGYLRRDRATGKYQLGPAVLSLGHPLLAQFRYHPIEFAQSAVLQICSPYILLKGIIHRGLRVKREIRGPDHQYL
jgi:DNA-binding IclR family transcriptional regulator